MQHRTSVPKTPDLSTDPKLWAAALKVISTGFCLCENLPSHDDFDRPCPKHAPEAYMVWELARGCGPEVLRPGRHIPGILTYTDENRQFHRIDGLPAVITVSCTGDVVDSKCYVRGERLPDEVHLMDRLYWDR